MTEGTARTGTLGAHDAAWKAAGVPLEARARRAYEIRHQARPGAGWRQAFMRTRELTWD